MEGRDGEYTQPAHRQLGGARGKGQEAFGVGQLTPLQAGQVAPEAEQIHVKLLQVLLPQEDLRRERDKTMHQINWTSRLLFVNSRPRWRISSHPPEAPLPVRPKFCQCAPSTPNGLMFTGAVEQDIVIIHWAVPLPVTELHWCFEEAASAMAEGSVSLPSSPETRKETIPHIPLADRGWECFGFPRRRPVSFHSCTMWNPTLPNRTAPTKHYLTDQTKAIWSPFPVNRPIKDNMSFAINWESGRLSTGAKCILCQKKPTKTKRTLVADRCVAEAASSIWYLRDLLLNPLIPPLLLCPSPVSYGAGPLPFYHSILSSSSTSSKFTLNWMTGKYSGKMV